MDGRATTRRSGSDGPNRNCRADDYADAQPPGCGSGGGGTRRTARRTSGSATRCASLRLRDLLRGTWGALLGMRWCGLKNGDHQYCQD